MPFEEVSKITCGVCSGCGSKRRVQISPPACTLSVHTVPSFAACQAVQSAKKQITENRVDEKTCPFGSSWLVPWVNCLQSHSGGVGAS